MNRIVMTILLFSAPIVAGAADDLKVSQLEQDVQNLQREVNAQAQRIEDLRRQVAQAGNQVPVAPSPAKPPPVEPPTRLWLDATRWKQVKIGMGELDVISLLGPPSSMRVTNQERVLLYAMEIGSSGFLAGSVTIRERAVTNVKTPVLQ